MRNVNTIRIGLASIVVVAHTYFLAGWGYAWLGPFGRSDLAVEAFFVISGLLIFRSFEHSDTTSGYFSRRLRRILPAYFMTVIAAVILGGLVTNYHVTEYIGIPTLKYLAWNGFFLNFMQPTLPGVFEGNLVPAVNGSLWTIKIELMFYAIVPIAVLLVRIFGPSLVLTFMYLASLAYVYSLFYLERSTSLKLPYDELSRQLPGQLRFFVAGAAAYYARDFLQRHIAMIVVSTIAAIIISPGLHDPALTPIVIAGLFVSMVHLPFDTNIKQIGDPSYGLYLFHFPIIQAFAYYGLLRERNLIYPALIYVIVFCLASLSWRFVEQPWMQRPEPRPVNG